MTEGGRGYGSNAIPIRKRNHSPCAQCCESLAARRSCCKGRAWVRLVIHHAFRTPGPLAVHHAALQCAVWQPTSAELRGSDSAGGNRDIEHGAYWMLAAIDAVCQGDIIESVMDRRDRTLFTDLRVQSVARRPDGYAQVDMEDAGDVEYP